MVLVEIWGRANIIPGAAPKAAVYFAVAGVLVGVLVLTGCGSASESQNSVTTSSGSASSSAQGSSSASASASVPPPMTPPPSFDRTRFSLDDPNSISVVSNKHRSLTPPSFEPGDLSTINGVPNNNGQPLREPAARAVEAMYADAVGQGISLIVASAYRSYSLQTSLYNGYVARDGQVAADTYSARPGYSEHQTGLAVDLDDGSGCLLEVCFESTAAGQWLVANGYKYGFVLRYPYGQDGITGFTYEPWHFRYVGVEIATELHNTGIVTLEQFFGLKPAPTY